MPQQTNLQIKNAWLGYANITLAYWLFMLTDGALRMLVLLHFHSLGFTPLQLAYLFLIYEIMGMVTNVVAGWLGTRNGVRFIVSMGLIAQIFALLAMTWLHSEWATWITVVYVMIVQGISGCAKDLTKTGAKSAIKRLLPEDDQSGLFRWVTALTGSKNAIKGSGFFIGAVLLGFLGFEGALLALALVLVLSLVAFNLVARDNMGSIKRKVNVKDVLSTTGDVNRLSVARLFLFASRDTWFVVALPVFIVSVVSQYSEYNAQTAFFYAGGFMVLWVIGYGFVQALTPRWLKTVDSDPSLVRTVPVASKWCGGLALFTLLFTVAIWILMHFYAEQQVIGLSQSLLVVVFAGLLLFGFGFAVNSALHSYLILALTSQSRATMDVGFYYMANAAGRLLGTLLSGISFQLGGLALSLMLSAILLLISYFTVKQL